MPHRTGRRGAFSTPKDTKHGSPRRRGDRRERLCDLRVSAVNFPLLLQALRMRHAFKTVSSRFCMQRSVLFTSLTVSIALLGSIAHGDGVRPTAADGRVL